MKNLTNVKTVEGKGRAWIRCALIEKALESYISSLTRREQLTKEWYWNYSILLQPEDLNMLIAFLAPLSMVEFSLCLKDFDFDNLPSNLGSPDDIVCFFSLFFLLLSLSIPYFCSTVSIYSIGSSFHAFPPFLPSFQATFTHFKPIHSSLS